MYSDISRCPSSTANASRTAFGCGTDSAVRLRTSSGLVAARFQPTAAPQS